MAVVTKQTAPSTAEAQRFMSTTAVVHGAALLSILVAGCGEGALTEPLQFGEIRQASYSPCTYWGVGGCDRPRVWVNHTFTSWYDKDGNRWAPVEPNRWYGISSCTALDCSIYSPKSAATSGTATNKYYAVARSDLKAYSNSSYLGLTPDDCMHRREMPTTSTRPSGFYSGSAHPADVLDSTGMDGGCAPLDSSTDGVGSNTGITGAPDGAPMLMWGTDTATGEPGVAPGFIGFAAFTGQPVIWTGFEVNRVWYNQRGLRVCDPVRHWLVWTQSPRGDVWVQQWMVQRVYNLFSPPFGWGDWSLIY